MFAADALLGNFDRHNGNWGFLYDPKNKQREIAPVYDCGSCLLPQADEETLQEVCLGIHSMCVGAESKYFNGHTNITDDAFLVFGVKGLMDTNKRLKDAMLFNILSFMSNQLLGKGNTAASIDELYLFLTQSNISATP